MKRKLVLFGIGDIAQLADYYFSKDSNYEVAAFTVDSQYLGGKDSFMGKPLVSFEEVQDHFPPLDYHMFIAVSYADMNTLRKKKYDEAKQKGYDLATYVSSKCNYLSEALPGDNCFILEDNTIQPFVTIGNNVFLWSGNHIGHHSIIHDDNFISSHVVISGHCIINKNCFLGVNATIAHQVEVAKFTLVGAGAVITKNTSEGSVWVSSRSIQLDKKSTDFRL